MTLPERFIRALLPSLLLAVPACGGSEPRESPPIIPLRYGRYDLIMYDAKLLPDTLRVIVGTSSTPGSTGSVSCPEILLGATLDVMNDGTFTRTSRLAYPCTGTLQRPTDLPDSLAKVESGHAGLLGSTVLFEFAPLSDTVPPSSEIVESGTMQGSDIVIDRVVNGGTNNTEILSNARVYQHE
jgi:hypothetical protein